MALSQSKNQPVDGFIKKAIELDDEQHRVIDLVRRKHSVFVTGPAGTGKSAILDELQNILPVTVTATTGLAAINVGGSTIHSWSGIGMEVEPDAILDKMKGYTKDRIRACDYLAIDEISMMGAMMMDLLDFICQQIRCSSEPFGGLTLIMFGDFLQLPPVGDLELAFQSDVWQNLEPKVVQLTRIYRQLDERHQRMLNGIRFGKPDKDSIALLSSRIDAVDPDPSRVPVKLYPTNRDVDHENQMMLALIKGEQHTFKSKDYASHPVQLGILKKNCRWPEELELKVGARVMLLLNRDIENGLANGSMGIVVEIRLNPWYDDEGSLRKPVIMVSFDIAPKQIIEIERSKFEINATENQGGRWASNVVASREQFPLRLAYAITIHKCVAGDTLTPTDRGLWRMEDICKVSDMPSVAGITEFKSTCDPYVGVEELGYRITTARGYSVVCSERHPLLTMSETGEEWVKAPSLMIGNKLRMRHSTFSGGDFNLQDGFTALDYHVHNDYRLPIKMTKELAWLLGALTGDGYLTDERDGRIDITSLDDEVINQFVAIMESEFGISATVVHPKANRVRVAYVHNIGVRRFLLHLGMSFTKAGTKRIPHSVLKSQCEHQAAFLSGLFDTDGGVNTAVHLTTSSIGLARDTQAVLANLGVIGTIASMRLPARRINITGVDAKRFLEVSGFTIAHKQRSLEKVVAKGDRKLRRVHTGAYPKKLGKLYATHLRREFREALLAREKGRKWTGLLYRISVGFASLTDYHLSELAEMLRDEVKSPLSEKLLSEASAGVFLDDIMNIERETVKMFDICVPDGHAFVGNVFINHNSQGMTLDKVKVYLASCFEAGQAYVALSRVRTLAGLYIGDFASGCIRANRVARDFYNKLNKGA